MDVKTAIAERRSIRKYKPDPVPEEVLQELLEAARLAPSGTNQQPWRFIVVKNPEVKRQIQEHAFNQKFLSEAPVLLVCCADISTYAKNTKKRLEELVEAGVFDKEIIATYPNANQPMDAATLKGYIPHAMLNVAIAMENIFLRAVSLGLGSCIVQLMRAKPIAQLLELPEHMIITALMPIGYPDQHPVQRPRLKLEDIIYKVID